MADFSTDKINEMAKLAIEALEDKKAEDIRVIDISQVSVLADYFIIANGSNRSQIQALSDSVEEKLWRAGYYKTALVTLPSKRRKYFLKSRTCFRR